MVDFVVEMGVEEVEFVFFDSEEGVGRDIVFYLGLDALNLLLNASQPV